MLRARVALMVLVACAALAPAAFAAGEKVGTKVKLTSTKITPERPGKAGVSWEMSIATADGSRARSIHQAELLIPKSFYAVTSGLRSCPLSTLDANDVNSCPAKSVVGRAQAEILTPEVQPEPFHSTGVIYYTGKKGKLATFGIYYTLTEIPSLHSVSQMRVSPPGRKKTKINMDQVPVPVPGLPDSTPLRIFVSFDKRNVFRANRKCRAGTMAPARYGFFDQSPASHDNNVFHTQIANPVTASAKAC
jgi:hypothetical protein